jgi:ABC-type branched-subunit amino acid transport system ATPase component
MLEVRNIHKSFGEQKVLQGIDLSIPTGQTHTLVGGNGTGKTTLFNLITGFLKPDSGSISLNHRRLDRISPVKINMKGITRTFQDLRVITQLSVKENILLSFKNNPGEKMFNAFLPQRLFKEDYKKLSDRAEEIIETIHLESVKHSLAGEISYGQQKLLTIGCCLANDAKLLLLDEPVAGIDKDNYQRIFNLVLKLKKEGHSILQIEHNHDYIESTTDGIWFMNEGKATFFESFHLFKTDPIVKEVYLN